MNGVKSVVIHKNNQMIDFSFFANIKQHRELIAALLCGILILIAWFVGKLDHEIMSGILYLLAFTIGGYAKAKEGLTATVINKELNVEMLMIFAAIGSAMIGYWTEGAILIFIFSLSGALETYTMNKSHNEISALMKIQPESALRIFNGTEQITPVENLVVGDHILIKAGERIPADGLIIKGQTTIDEAAITGESIPVFKKIGDDIFTGTVNLTGSLTVEVSKPSSETLFQKIINLVQSAQSEKLPSQLFIERFEGTYVKIVLALVLIMMFLPHYLFNWSWSDTFYRAMILLVVASPCALVASIMPATLSAISNGARHGILFKGGAHLENLSNLKAIAFDKTGTITEGKPEVTDFIHQEEEITALIQVIASIENESNHPLAKAIIKYLVNQANFELISPDQIKDIAGWGIKAVMNGEEWLIGKADLVGKAAAETFENGIYHELMKAGKTVVFVKNSKKIVAILALKDIIRSEAKTALSTLNDQGIKTVMLTGDSRQTAKAIAKDMNLDEYRAECLPEKKADYLKSLKARYGAVAMVGDGINDAPALATADIGIAIGDGSDIALETADVVLMKNELSRITDAIHLSKRMNRIIKQNIFFSIAVILLLIASNFLGKIDLPFGVIGHEGSTILVILNSLRLLK